MKSYNYNKTIFPRGIVLRVSIAVFCGILCLYLYCGTSIANFFFVTLPSGKRSLLTPECLFLLLNAIVAFLVGESRLGPTNPSVTRSKDIYEEHVERSGSMQRVSNFSHYGNSTDSEIVKPDDPVEDKVGEDKNMREQSGTWEAEKVKDEDDHDDNKGAHENNGGNNDEDDDGGLGADELNKRVEEFIAKVNQQRWIEARSVICT